MTYADIRAELDALEARLSTVDRLNQTLLTATTAYQIRMAEQEFTIHQQQERIVELEEQVTEYRGYP